MRGVRHLTSTDYARPHRPRPVRLANRVLDRLGRAGVGGASLEPGPLMQTALRATGRARFADESFREPLRVLLASVEREARLHPLGRLITRGRVLGALSTRLRAEATLEVDPGIRDEPIPAPIVITGPARSGTTVLHRLLAADPSLRALASWEALDPVSPRRRPRLGGDPRVRAARMSELGVAYLAPDFFAVHPIDATAPDEEILLLDYAFMSTVPEATLRVPSYGRWLEQQDQTPAYRYMKLLLQLLQRQRRAGRWVLKTPHHLEWLDTLLSVFPDALIVQTHRDPQRTTASLCSLVAHGRGVFSDAIDAHEIGRDWLRKTSRMMRRALETRDRLGEDRFVDVAYEELVRDPYAVARRIYDRAGMELHPATERRMAATLGRHRQHAHGRHRYRLADFGLGPEDVERQLGGYRERFAIPIEGEPA